MDLLVARAEVDPKRIGYVGHSLGANYGAILAGVEKRIKAFVLMTGSPSETENLRSSERPDIVATRESTPKHVFERYLKIMAPLDAGQYVAHAQPAALLFQFGREDEFITEKEATQLHQTASEPKLIQWYQTGHALDAEALRARDEWLGQQLDFHMSESVSTLGREDAESEAPKMMDAFRSQSPTFLAPAR